MEQLFQTARRVRFAVPVLFCAFAVSACVTVPSSDTVERIPITVQGNMSTVCLALAQRQNAIQNADRTYTHPDGLEFYFVIYPAAGKRISPEEKPAAENGRTPVIIPTIRKAQQFTIDGKPYWQNLSGSIDSQTVIYTARSFGQSEPEIAARIDITQTPDVFIQKTILCGEPLPRDGVVRYPFYFGFGQELEEFEFRFRLRDVL
jgi:hypothetical protein